MGYLVVFLAVMVCSLVGSTAYYKVEYDRLSEKKYNYTQSQIDEKMALATSSNEWQKMKNNNLVALVRPGAQVDELEVRLNGINNNKKLLKSKVYIAIKMLTTYLRDNIGEKPDVATFIQCRKLSLLVTEFCSNEDVSFTFDEEGYVIQSAVDRRISLEKVSEIVEGCR